MFPNSDIVKDTRSTEGELFPIFRIRKDGQDILVINPTSDYQRIFSVGIKSKTVKNKLGANLGSTYHEVYGNQLDTFCREMAWARWHTSTDRNSPFMGIIRNSLETLVSVVL